MEIPQVNIEYVKALIQRAEQKLLRFEEKLSTIETHIALLQKERESAKLIIEHISQSDARKRLLLDLFVFPDEYGQSLRVPDGYMSTLEEHVKHMDASLHFYEYMRTRRTDGIAFLKSDIERLKKIAEIKFQRRFFFLAVLDT